MIEGEEMEAGGAITSLATLTSMQDKSALVGREVDLEGMQVESVVGDSSFFVVPSEGGNQRLLVVLQGLGETGDPSGEPVGADGEYNVDAGDVVDVQGTIEEFTQEVGEQSGVTGADAERALSDGIYLNANTLNVMEQTSLLARPATPISQHRNAKRDAIMGHIPLSKTDDWKLEHKDQDIRGWEVRDANDRKIGKVDEMMVNTDTEYVDQILLENGTTYPARDIHIGDRVVYVEGVAEGTEGVQPVVKMYDDYGRVQRSETGAGARGLRGPRRRLPRALHDHLRRLGRRLRRLRAGLPPRPRERPRRALRGPARTRTLRRTSTAPTPSATRRAVTIGSRTPCATATSAPAPDAATVRAVDAERRLGAVAPAAVLPSHPPSSNPSWPTRTRQR